MSLNHHKKSQFGGELGKEFDRVWEAIRQNQILSGKGQRIRRTPNGTFVDQTVVSEGSVEVVSTTELTATFLYDPWHPATPYHWPMFGPPYESTKQLAMWMNVSVGGPQLVLLPPTQWGSGDLTADGNYWPLDLADNQYMNCGAATHWFWMGKLEQGVQYQVLEFVDSVYSDSATGSNVTGTSYVAEKGENGVAITHPTKILYYLDPNDPELTVSGNGWSPC